MPWCDDCSKFWNAPELAADGECPTCGRVLTARAKRKTPAAGAAPLGALVGRPVSGPADEEPATATPDGAASAARVARAKGAPWHFKLMVVGVTVYMVYRIYWLIEWLPKHV